jgi:hypothetical protein
MPNPEFWYEELASQTAMHGPGVTILLSRSSEVAHSLRLTRVSEPADDSGESRPLVFVHSILQKDADQRDPTRVLNPVYQEIVQHELPDGLRPGLCVLLTGSLFEHHFSAVFSLYRDQSIPSRVVLDVDVADRCRAPIAELAATYDVDYERAAHSVIDIRPSIFGWQFGPRGAAKLELLAIPQATIGEPNSSHPSRVQINAAIDPQTHTQRLHYCWRWTS